MSRTRLSNIKLGNPKLGNELARFQIQAAQAYCGRCAKYLTYFDDASSDTSILAITELTKHNKEYHDSILP